MILVDTSVWIDLFRARRVVAAQKLTELLEAEQDVCTCGIIQTEILQGIRENAMFERLNAYFAGLIILTIEQEHFITAAQLFRSARSRGKTIRSTVDCIIAACAIAHKVPVLTSDRDFERIREISKLQLL